jgi:CBS domain containing-hemolysin-like protein
MLARLGIRSGDIEADHGIVIQNVLSLEDKTAREIMTPRTVVFALDAKLTVEDAHARGILHSRIPVCDGDLDDVVGIVHRRDIVAAVADDRHALVLEALMKPVHFVLETTTVDRLLRMFLDRRQHMFVVLDEFGGLCGVVTLEDVLEEILGREIVDEFDEVPDMRELAHQRRRAAVRKRGEKRSAEARSPRRKEAEGKA